MRQTNAVKYCKLAKLVDVLGVLAHAHKSHGHKAMEEFARSCTAATRIQAFARVYFSRKLTCWDQAQPQGSAPSHLAPRPTPNSSGLEDDHSILDAAVLRAESERDEMQRHMPTSKNDTVTRCPKAIAGLAANRTKHLAEIEGIDAKMLKATGKPLESLRRARKKKEAMVCSIDHYLEHGTWLNFG